VCKVLIVYYSMYGHIYRMAEAIAEGVREVAGCEALVKRVLETLPYFFAGQMGIGEVTGCSPYGASTITGGQGEWMPSENKLACARFQGAHVAKIAKKLRE